ncbi:hypothetical protein Tco_1206845 [Tanacetum coccineum]
MPQNQGSDMGQTDDDWFKRPKEPSSPDPELNAKKVRKPINFRPPQTWISRIAKAIKPPLTFDEPMNTPIDFSAYVMHNLKIDNLKQQHLVGPGSKGHARVEWNWNFISKNDIKLKPLPLIEVQGRQVVPADYFINNDLGYLKGGSLSRKYTTSTTKTKAAKYDNIEGIKDMVPTLWNLVKVAYDRYALWGISHWGQK